MWQYIGVVIALLSFVFNFGLGVYVFISNRQAAKDKELQDTKTRIVTLEEKVKNMPSHSEISEMQQDIRGLQAEVEGQGKTLNSMEASLRRVEDYLLNNKRAP